MISISKKEDDFWLKLPLRETKREVDRLTKSGTFPESFLVQNELPHLFLVDLEFLVSSSSSD